MKAPLGAAAKGQLISKCLFGVQKTNRNKSTRTKVEFVRSFFGRNVGLKKSFRICLTFKQAQCFGKSNIGRLKVKAYLLDIFWLHGHQIPQDFDVQTLFFFFTFK